MYRAAILLSLLWGIGCSGPDASIMAIRQRFLAGEIEGPERPVPEIREELSAGTLQESDLFTIRARANAGDFSPFVENMATFMVTDATGHDGDEAHNPHECPFCKRDIDSVMARVVFQGDDGSAIKSGVQQLFDLKEMDLVVIRGSGRMDEDGMLVITADRMSVRR